MILTPLRFIEFFPVVFLEAFFTQEADGTTELINHAFSFAGVELSAAPSLFQILDL